MTLRQKDNYIKCANKVGLMTATTIKDYDTWKRHVESCAKLAASAAVKQNCFH